MSTGLLPQPMKPDPVPTLKPQAAGKLDIGSLEIDENQRQKQISAGKSRLTVPLQSDKKVGLRTGG